MRGKTGIVCVLVLIAALSGCVSPVSRETGTTALVVPSRYTIVELAFNIARLRPAVLVAYEAGNRGAPANLYVWNGRTRTWVEVEEGELDRGAMSDAAPARAIVIGSEDDVPDAILQKASAWSAETFRIPTLDIVTLLNEMHKSLKFSSSEWRWLARFYNIELEDRNSERRRWGRYGKPGEKRVVPVPGEVTMPTSEPAARSGPVPRAAVSEPELPPPTEAEPAKADPMKLAVPLSIPPAPAAAGPEKRDSLAPRGDAALLDVEEAERETEGEPEAGVLPEDK